MSLGSSEIKDALYGGFCYLPFSSRWVSALANPFPTGDYK